MKTVVFIDGENLRHRLATALIESGRINNGQDLKNFDLRGLIEALVPELNNIEIRYYGAKVKQQGKHQSTRKKILAIIQQKRAWNSNLQKQGIKYLETGVLKVRSDGQPKNSEYFIEKGVDVGLAVDMIVSALKQQIGHIILISSDADLLPAVKALKQEKVKVTYVAHESFILPSLAQFSDATRTITNTQILHYFDAHNRKRAK